MTQLSATATQSLSHLVRAIDAWESRSEAQGLGGLYTTRAAQAARDSLPSLLQDNSHLNPEQLETLAELLSPGAGYDRGWLVRLAYETLALADPLLIAATMRWNWRDSKVGFAFLPDPAAVDAETYIDLATQLFEMLQNATEHEPRRILTGADQEFLDALPIHFTVYRGCSGIPEARARAGLCWSLGRDWANWFAGRGGGDPIVMMARVRKTDLAFVIASEQEVVVQPRYARQVKWHKQLERPDFRSRP